MDIKIDGLIVSITSKEASDDGEHIINFNVKYLDDPSKAEKLINIHLLLM